MMSTITGADPPVSHHEEGSAAWQRVQEHCPDSTSDKSKNFYLKDWLAQLWTG